MWKVPGPISCNTGTKLGSCSSKFYTMTILLREEHLLSESHNNHRNVDLESARTYLCSRVMSLRSCSSKFYSMTIMFLSLLTLVASILTKSSRVGPSPLRESDSSSIVPVSVVRLSGVSPAPTFRTHSALS